MRKAKWLVLLVAAVLVVSAVAFSSCEKEVETRTAYGLVHREGYVGMATVEVKGGKIISADIDEACFPSQVKAKAEDGNFTVKNADNIFYKTVKAAGVTYVYDLDSSGYKVGDQTIKEFFRDNEERCQAYFEAVKANAVTVVTSAGEKTDIMTAATLLKKQNGYWAGDSIHEGQLGWSANVEATCNYVITNGFGGGSKATDFVQSDDNCSANSGLDNEWKDKDGKYTGATWSDFWDYFSLLQKAFNKSAE